MKRVLLAVLLATAACAPNRGAGYEKALGEAQAAYGRGRFDVAADRYDEAARAAKIPRDGAHARYEAALARARAGDIARATTELRKLAGENTEYADSAALKLADLVEKQDPEAGRAAFEDVVVRFPSTISARLAFERLLRHKDDEGPAASLAFIDALAAKLPPRSGLEEALQYQHARREADLGHKEKARDALVAVANANPYPKGAYFDDALFRASEIEQDLGRPREAIALLEHLLSFREMSVTIGSYERPRYIPALLRIAKLYEDALGDRGKARDAYHRLYREFKTSTLRDDALWREAELWQKDNDASTACDRLGTLVSDIPDSRYVPCAVAQCPSLKRSAASKSPRTCHAYLTRDPSRKAGEDVAPTIDTTRPDDPK